MVSDCAVPAVWLVEPEMVKVDAVPVVMVPELGLVAPPSTARTR